MRSYIKNLFVFLFSLIASILNGYFFNYLNEKYFHYSFYGDGVEGLSKGAQFFLIVLFLPLIETALLNKIPNTVLKKLKITNEFVLIIVPSIVFSIWHYYNPIYVLMAFVEGIILNWCYVYCQKNTRYTFLLVCLLHTSYNLYDFLLITMK
jgi:hypothetical protein